MRRAGRVINKSFLIDEFDLISISVLYVFSKASFESFVFDIFSSISVNNLLNYYESVYLYKKNKFHIIPFKLLTNEKIIRYIIVYGIV